MLIRTCNKSEFKVGAHDIHRTYQNAQYHTMSSCTMILITLHLWLPTTIRSYKWIGGFILLDLMYLKEVTWVIYFSWFIIVVEWQDRACLIEPGKRFPARHWSNQFLVRGGEPFTTLVEGPIPGTFSNYLPSSHFTSMWFTSFYISLLLFRKLVESVVGLRHTTSKRIVIANSQRTQ